ncbi:hypothetical protein [Hubei narna-like virus 18]|uniref:hypothetical protein n=1 Tax=Hubei narna-like virus 18 TaxID=1922948 RepID=UPI00090BD9B2|nr:hypothetical protein [Hubei narna-like virus 18]APG77103.1 hypothetical protein [Hubei narna-like virus 18]
MQWNWLRMICGIISGIVEKHTLPTITGKIFRGIRVKHVDRFSLWKICNMLPIVLKKIARISNVELPHSQLEVMRLVRGCITNTRSMLEIRVQLHRTPFIRDSAPAQFHRACYWDAEATGYPKYVSNRTTDRTVRHLALPRWVIRRPLGVPSAHLPESATLIVQMDETLKGDIIQIGYRRNDLLICDYKVIESGSCQGVSFLGLPGNLHGLFREGTTVFGDNRFITVYLKTNLFHDSKVLPWRAEHTEEVISSDDIRATFVSRLMDTELVQKRECEETQRGSHLNTATRGHGNSVRIRHPNGCKHPFKVVFNPFREVKRIENSSPECLCVLVGYVVRRVGQIRRYDCTVSVQRTADHILELLRAYILIEVHIRVRLEYGPQLSADDITRKESCGWELAEYTGLKPGFRNGENVHVISGDLFVSIDSSFDDSIVKVLLMTIKVLAQYDGTLRHNSVGIVHKVSQSTTRASRNISASRSFRWMEGHPLTQAVFTLVNIITSVAINLVCQTNIQLWSAGHNAPVFPERLVYNKFVPNREHSCYACKLCTRLCMTAEAAKPVSKCSWYIPRVIRLLSSYRPDTVVEGQRFNLLADILLTTGTTTGSNKPPRKHLSGDQIREWSPVYGFYNDSHTLPDVGDKLSLSFIRQGRHWQLVPVTCPDNTGDDRPRQDILR